MIVADPLGRVPLRHGMSGDRLVVVDVRYVRVVVGSLLGIVPHFDVLHAGQRRWGLVARIHDFRIRIGHRHLDAQ